MNGILLESLIMIYLLGFSGDNITVTPTGRVKKEVQEYADAAEFVQVEISRQGCVKFLILLFIIIVGEEFPEVTGEGNIMAVGKNLTWKKGKQYHPPYNIKAVGRNINR